MPHHHLHVDRADQQREVRLHRHRHQRGRGVRVLAASNEIRPDEKPSPPDAPAVKAGDKNMVITWPPAKTEGSPVKHYNLEISPPPANGIAVKNEVTGLSYTWPG